MDASPNRSPSELDVSRRRSPSELRDLLEVRVRRMAQTYDADVRRESLTEIRDLAAAAIEQLDEQ